MLQSTVDGPRAPMSYHNLSRSALAATLVAALVYAGCAGPNEGAAGLRDDAGAVDDGDGAADATPGLDTDDGTDVAEPDDAGTDGDDADDDGDSSATDADDDGAEADATTDAPPADASDTRDTHADVTEDADGGSDADVAPNCGDGVIDDGEACDDGEANDDRAPNACRTDCAPARCGDGVVDDGEACDDGDDDDRDACSNGCREVLAALCRRCETDDECGHEIDTCVMLGDGGHCAVDCADGGACPTGFVCTELFEGETSVGEQCLPESDVCAPCLDGDDDGYGTGEACLGFDCADDDDTRHPGRAERCDGVDNDCDDGTPDGSDEARFGRRCDNPDDDDRCTDGVYVCDGAEMVCDDDDESIPEICNARNDDCDPDTPDGADEPGFGTACDNPDDDDLCTDGTVVCYAGELLCSDDSGTIPDLCNGEDDDCNPDTPDGADEPTLGDECDGADLGICPEGEVFCDTDGLGCSDTTGDDLELCGGGDDDCDGEVDEDWVCLPRGEACVSPFDLGVGGTFFGSLARATAEESSCEPLGEADHVFALTVPEGGARVTFRLLFGPAVGVGIRSTCRTGPADCSVTSVGDTWSADLPAGEIYFHVFGRGAYRFNVAVGVPGACLTPDEDEDGSTLCDGDCDDDDPNRFPGQIELCNGRDDDCNGVRDDPTDACVVEGEIGVCADGIRVCDGASERCEQVGFPTGELCGEVDDLSGPCTVTGAFGPCAEGAHECRGGAATCRQTVFAEAMEICGNEIDDDCDDATDETPCEPLAPSPDYNPWIVFLNSPGLFDVPFLAPADDSDARRPIDEDGFRIYLSPVFSPDGSTVAYAFAAETLEIRFLTLATGERTTWSVSVPAVAVRHLSYSRNGTHLAFLATSPPDRSNNIYTLELATGVVTQLTFTSSPAYNNAPVWSRDGATIYYVAGDSSAVGDVYSMPSDTGAGVDNTGRTRWTTFANVLDRVDVNFEGDELIITRLDHAPTLLDLTTGETTPSALTAVDGACSYFSAGTRVACARGAGARDIVVLDLADGTLIQNLGSGTAPQVARVDSSEVPLGF